MRMKNLLFLTIGGTAGTILRYFMTNFINKFSFFTFEIGTLFVNILGCFIIGFLSNMGHLSNNLKILLITGFCGAFTTFSTFIFEAEKSYFYIFLSIILGVVFFKLGGFLCQSFQ